tara:strand:- start:14432 stop:15235 length:804 start_codon:yes stop_codon:yes gene_type:complete
LNPIEKVPNDPTVALHIDRYQFYDFKEPAYLKTLPNGKFDSYYISNGGFSVLNQDKESFEKVPNTGLFLASNGSSLLRIEQGLKCINIKLKISALAHPNLNLPNTNQLLIPFSFPYTKKIKRSIDARLSTDKPVSEIDWLDALFKDILESIPQDEKIIKVLEEFTNLENEDIGFISQSLNMTTKSLYRFVKKHFSLSPKQLKDIIRFDLTTSFLKKNPSTNLVEALSFGYYDQSHFVKECRKITGYSPKELFNDMHFTTNDLIRKVK